MHVAFLAGPVPSVPLQEAGDVEGKEVRKDAFPQPRQEGRATGDEAAYRQAPSLSRAVAHPAHQQPRGGYWIRRSRQSRTLARVVMDGGLIPTRRECTPPVALLAVTNRSGALVLGL